MFSKRCLNIFLGKDLFFILLFLHQNMSSFKLDFMDPVPQKTKELLKSLEKDGVLVHYSGERRVFVSIPISFNSIEKLRPVVESTYRVSTRRCKYYKVMGDFDAFPQEIDVYFKKQPSADELKRMGLSFTKTEGSCVWEVSVNNVNELKMISYNEAIDFVAPKVREVLF